MKSTTSFYAIFQGYGWPTMQTTEDQQHEDAVAAINKSTVTVYGFIATILFFFFFFLNTSCLCRVYTCLKRLTTPTNPCATVQRKVLIRVAPLKCVID